MTMKVLETTDGQTDLPRYFAPVFDQIRDLKCGQLDIELPDGRVFRAKGKEPGSVAVFKVHNDDLFSRLIREGDLGFAEAYLDGWWSTPDLMAVLDLAHESNENMLDGFAAISILRAYERVRNWFYQNTRKQARKNISHHYDLGNDFYGRWLDDTMTYSSALFTTGQESTEAAQQAKYGSIIDQMGAKHGEHVLEIGCGWGGFAEYAARERGLRVTGLTISEEQFKYAQKRIQDAGLQDQVEFKLCDYRDETGKYDGIASIEMFEAVGQKYWPVYFDAVRERLKPGRNATLQIITIEDWRFPTYSKNVDFIQKYIFPGGILPGPTVLREEIARAGLVLQNSIEFGESYSQTLRRWYETFNETWDDISAMGFDDRFRRMWNFYLTSCAAAFRTGVCDVTQITMRAPST